MSNKGYTRIIAAKVGSMPNGSLVTVDDARAWLGHDAQSNNAPAILGDLSRGDDPMLERVRIGVYRVIGGRRGGRPRGVPTKFANGAPEPAAKPTPAPAPAPNGAAMPADHAAVVMMTLVRALADGSAVYADDETGALYKVVRVA